MEIDLPSPTALIIGASRGLGLAIAEEYLRRGWQVTGTVRRTARTALHRVADQSKGRLAVEKVDIIKPAQIAALRRRLAKKRFDLLFVNAGIMNDDTIAEVSTADFVHVMVTNALGPMRVVEAFEDLVKRSGTIGVMSSGLGSISGSDGYLQVYSASKAALNMLMKGFAARHAARTTVIIAPGWVRTHLGGPDAPLSIAQSIPRVVDVITSRTGKRGLLFVNYRGETVPW
jgi:NAD(P)-dependent dehydrogenase (short-subunit alcohol dehydrogenase family)